MDQNDQLPSMSFGQGKNRYAQLVSESRKISACIYFIQNFQYNKGHYVLVNNVK